MGTAAISINRAEQNRRNSQHSTGPKTEAGKKRSSLNALRHGFTSHIVVLPSEDIATYKAFVEKSYEIHAPKDDRQKEVVQRLADLRWRLNRCGAVEANLYALGHEEHAGKFHLGDGPNMQGIQAGLAAATTFKVETETFLKLSLFEHRMVRAYQAALAELRYLQEASQAKLKQETETAVIVYRALKQKNLPFQPADFGFVSKLPDLDAALRLADLLQTIQNDVEIRRT